MGQSRVGGGPCALRMGMRKYGNGYCFLPVRARATLVVKNVNPVTYSRNRPRPSSSSSMLFPSGFLKDDENEDEDEKDTSSYLRLRVLRETAFTNVPL